MSTATSWGPLIGYLHQLAGQTEVTDCQLLERFVRQRDHEAFQVLVRRHGRLVLGVCRRALRQRQDAEDCFQATFLVLARKAGAVRWQDSIAGWLYQVAARLAAEVRVREARRARREKESALRRAVPQGADLRELAAALDEEMGQLTERYRDPLLLCYLEGLTRDQAAARLGWPLRTLERRLSEARGRLQARLARRGLTLSAGLVAWSVAQDASAVPRALLNATVQVVAGCRAVPPRTAALVASAARTLLWDKVRQAAGALALAVLLVAGAGLAVRPAPALPAAPLPGGAPAQAKVPPVAPVTAPRLQEAGTAAAVEEGLRWLVRKQHQNGSWKLDGGAANDVAATALALLPLLRGMEVPRANALPADAAHAAAVRRGLKYLVSRQTADGSFAGGMYAHALAAIALADGLRRTGDAQLTQPAQRAIDYIVQAQHEAGGWRYAPRQPGDTSVTSWHVLALKRGQEAGLAIPAEVFKKASAYLDSVATDDRAAYGYVAPGQGSVAMIAAGLYCRRLLGWEARHAALVKGASFLKESPPGNGQGNVYYYHYATHVMAHVGGAEWEFWEPRIARYLLKGQEHAGPDGGSWPPAGDAFGAAGGRLMVTSLALLTFQECGHLERTAPGATRRLKDEEAARFWDDLAGDDVAQVRRAMQALAGAPVRTVPFLRKRLQPPTAPDAQKIAQLIKDLGSDAFEARAASFQELRRLGPPVAPALCAALKDGISLELRRRLEQLIEAADRRELSGRAQQLRAVQALELAGTAEARTALRLLAESAPGTTLERAARQALQRLAKDAP
jgi:RNA polymerase sigma factor (sigma-70 family)